MKKVVFLLLFLLNLQVIADHIGIPLGDSALHAQNYNNEGYYDCYDDGEWYISSFPCEIEACVTTCPFCHESYPCRDSHLCPIPPAPSDDTWGNDYDDEEEDHTDNGDDNSEYIYNYNDSEGDVIVECSHHCPCLMTYGAMYLQDMIDSDYRWGELNKKYDSLTDALKRQIAFPETVQQGDNLTCASAVIQKFLVENYPQEYIDCVYNLAKYGVYDKWGLVIPAESNLNSITALELQDENGKARATNLENDIDYTAVDAIMQTAIQNMVDNNTFIKMCHNYNTGYAYNPLNNNILANGMTYYDEYEVLKWVTAQNIAIANSHKMNYNDLLNMLDNYNPDSYTFIAGIEMADFGFNQRGGHAIEITGANNGSTDFWTWGRYGFTLQSDCPIRTLIVIEKTNYAKQEKKTKSTLRCYCSACTNISCSVCM